MLIRFVLFILPILLAASATAGDIMVDNEDGRPTYTESGDWRTGDHPGYSGHTYRFAENNGVLRTATWTPEITTAGVYHVYAGYLASFNRPRAAYYTINHAQGSTVARLDQYAPSAQFRTAHLGTFTFKAGSKGSVQIANVAPESAATIADMIIFRPAAELPAGTKPPSELFLQLEDWPKRPLKLEEE